jgi:hypothetical protein
MCDPPSQPIMDDVFTTGSDRIDAERAFLRVTRQRRRAALGCRLRRGGCTALPVYDSAPTAVRALGVREIPLDAIEGTLEPSRSAMFDQAFRPARVAAQRWQRVWMAEQQGRPLPPISVVQVDGAYAVADGHHRVSVARARGAATIDATVVGRAA